MQRKTKIEMDADVEGGCCSARFGVRRQHLDELKARRSGRTQKRPQISDELPRDRVPAAMSI